MNPKGRFVRRCNCSVRRCNCTVCTLRFQTMVVCAFFLAPSLLELGVLETLHLVMSATPPEWSMAEGLASTSVACWGLSRQWCPELQVLLENAVCSMLS